MALGSRQGRHNLSCNAMEIEMQRQLAFFLLVGHGNRFIEEILPPLFSFDSVLAKAPSQPHLAERTRFCSSGWLHSCGVRSDVYRQKECLAGETWLLVAEVQIV
jgi:hypothetical protein